MLWVHVKRPLKCFQHLFYVSCVPVYNEHTTRIFFNDSVIAKLQLFGEQLRGCHRISLAFLAGYQKKGTSIVRR